MASPGTGLCTNTAVFSLSNSFDRSQEEPRNLTSTCVCDLSEQITPHCSANQLCSLLDWPDGTNVAKFHPFSRKSHSSENFMSSV